MRGLAYNRKKSFTKAKRKQNICKNYYGWEYYNNLHEYSKNKIHCSCVLCRAKTAKHRMIWSGGRTKGKHWKPSDYIKIIKMQEEENAWNNSNGNF